MTDYFHLSGITLDAGSIILPGNWGRLIRAHGWRHNLAVREMALEQERLKKFPTKPSRLECVYVFLSLEEAEHFRSTIAGFFGHILYQVSLCEPLAASHIADHRLCGPVVGSELSPDWTQAYWEEIDVAGKNIAGINWPTIAGAPQRELLTLSKLRIERRIT